MKWERKKHTYGPRDVNNISWAFSSSVSFIVPAIPIPATPHFLSVCSQWELEVLWWWWWWWWCIGLPGPHPLSVPGIAVVPTLVPPCLPSLLLSHPHPCPHCLIIVWFVLSLSFQCHALVLCSLWPHCSHPIAPCFTPWAVACGSGWGCCCGGGGSLLLLSLPTIIVPPHQSLPIVIIVIIWSLSWTWLTWLSSLSLLFLLPMLSCHSCSFHRWQWVIDDGSAAVGMVPLLFALPLLLLSTVSSLSSSTNTVI